MNLLPYSLQTEFISLKIHDQKIKFFKMVFCTSLLYDGESSSFLESAVS